MGTRIGVIGAGGWGSCLSLLFLKNNHAVTMWEAFPQYAAFLQQRRENIHFLPGVKLPEELKISSSLSEVVTTSELLVIAVPTEFFRTTLNRMKNFYQKDQSLLIATKGLERQTGLTMSEVVRQVLGEIPLAVLSGPCIARELAKGFPSAAVVASRNSKVASYFQKALSSDILRLYSCCDVRGVELGGALKNVMAIGAGVIDGLGLGVNTKAAYLTRCLKEMVEIGVLLGGQEKTFYGLSGLGDLLSTSFSPYSRNRTFGQTIVSSNKEEFFRHSRMVVEGYFTVASLYRFAVRRKLPAPITRAVYRIVYLNSSPGKELQKLMTRRLKSE